MELILASKILGIGRWDAESILGKAGYSLAEAAEIVAIHTGARTQTIIGSVREISLTMIKARATTLRLAA